MLNTNSSFIYLGFYVAFNTVKIILQQVVGKAHKVRPVIGPRSQRWAGRVLLLITNSRQGTTQVYITLASAEIKLYKGIIIFNHRVKLGTAPTQDVAVHLEMFAKTHPRELAQGTTRVVPCLELAPNITTLPPWSQIPQIEN